MSRSISLLLCAFLLGAGAACDRPAPPTQDAPARAQSQALDSVAPPVGPHEALAAYLAASVFRKPAVMPDSLDWCPDPGGEEGWEPDEYIAIAQPRVLGLRGTGDGKSQEVVAAVVRLAEVTRAGSGWVARIRVRPDTLVWTLLRRPSGAWSVCGPAHAAWEDGAFSPLFLVTEEFARMGEINAARWSPGASWDAVGRLADSLVTLRAAGPRGPKPNGSARAVGYPEPFQFRPPQSLRSLRVTSLPSPLPRCLESRCSGGESRCSRGKGRCPRGKCGGVGKTCRCPRSLDRRVRENPVAMRVEVVAQAC